MRILHEALWMQAQGHRLLVVAPEHSRLVQEAQRLGLETYHIPFTRKTRLHDFRHLKRYLRRLTPDILNTHSSIDSWVGSLAGRACRIPAVIRTRHVSTPVRSHVLNRWLYRSLCDHVFTTADCISAALVADLGLAANRVSTVSTGIKPPDHLPACEEARRSLILALEVPPDTRFIGCLAVLRSWKGHEILLEAFRQIQAQVPRYHLLIVGEGSQRPHLEGFINASGLQKRVHLLGHRTDPWFVLRALDLKVLASTSNEGISQSLLQAQFAECPVIGSDCGGIPEIIRHEETGLLVPRGDAAPLGQALLRLVQDRELAHRLAHRARQCAQQYHTVDIMGHKILITYRELLRGENASKRAGLG
jgi:glycosyltransferase involved in cell wall biosynthesis